MISGGVVRRARGGGQAFVFALHKVARNRECGGDIFRGLVRIYQGAADTCRGVSQTCGDVAHYPLHLEMCRRHYRRLGRPSGRIAENLQRSDTRFTSTKTGVADM